MSGKQRPTPTWGARPLVVLVGGPRDQSWYFADDWDQERRVDDYFDRATVYRKTTETLAHPDVDAAGIVWRHDAELAARTLAERERRGRELGIAGQDLATAHNENARDRGLELLRRAALHVDVLSADTIRDDLEAAKVPGQVRAGLWRTAVARGWVEAVASKPSGGESAHGKDIDVYRSLLYVATERQAG